ncbi:unnamed protein product [Chrysoparadoxa australica]
MTETSTPPAATWPPISTNAITSTKAEDDEGILMEGVVKKVSRAKHRIRSGSLKSKRLVVSPRGISWGDDKRGKRLRKGGCTWEQVHSIKESHHAKTASSSFEILDKEGVSRRFVCSDSDQWVRCMKEAHTHHTRGSSSCSNHCSGGPSSSAELPQGPPRDSKPSPRSNKTSSLLCSSLLGLVPVAAAGLYLLLCTSPMLLNDAALEGEQQVLLQDASSRSASLLSIGALGALALVLAASLTLCSRRKGSKQPPMPARGSVVEEQPLPPSLPHKSTGASGEHLTPADMASQEEVMRRRPADPPSESSPLNRWEVDCGGSVDKAKAKMAASLAWRESKCLNDILERPQPYFDRAKRHFPHFVCGVNRSGEHVMYERPGFLDLEAAVKDGLSVDILIEHLLFVYEYVWRVLVQDDEARLMSVIDMKNVSMSKGWQEALEFIKKMSSVVQDNYVERCSKTLIVNAPSWFGVLWRCIKPCISEQARNRVVVATTAHTFQLLSQLIDPGQIPKMYGGLGSFAEEENSPTIAHSWQEMCMKTWVDNLHAKRFKEEEEVICAGESQETTRVKRGDQDEGGLAKLKNERKRGGERTRKLRLSLSPPRREWKESAKRRKSEVLSAQPEKEEDRPRALTSPVTPAAAAAAMRPPELPVD